ncbi:uncharacterized protein LOC122010498 [Zingiber officinale]|uniref:uncharacterized protein LOC122010498 n=1 Tax=Zingiber officinale TaxID=94328 RepID=UPI001C4BC4C6|nr:uncharacterized protein LOC122010498 [Zingiber officinale]
MWDKAGNLVLPRANVMKLRDRLRNEEVAAGLFLCGTKNGPTYCREPMARRAEQGTAKAPGFKQLTGNLKQSGSVECGYCMMRYMKEIVECENPQLEKMFARTIKNQYYNQSQYDEVRSEWSEFIYSYLDA